MKPKELEQLGFERWYDDVDGTEDYMYELKVAPGFTLYSDYISDADGDELEIYWEQYCLHLNTKQLSKLIELLKAGLNE